MDTASEYAVQNLVAVRKNRPLVHSITNLVSINTVANALLAAGGAPVMAFAPEEVGEVAEHADALVLNTGTLTENRLKAMQIAGRRAASRGIPLAVDPVGAGISSFRTRALQEILTQLPVQVLRGNPSEILALRRKKTDMAGVDAVHSMEQARRAAVEVAAEFGITVAVTGPVDLVTDGRRALLVANGHPLLTRITGAGCTATAMIAMFLAVASEPLRSAASALAYFGLAAEMAAASTEAPGSFWIRLLDVLYAMTPAEFAEGCRITTASIDR